MDEKGKDFLAALAVILFISLLSVAIVLVRIPSENRSDVENYYKNEAAQVAKHPLPIYQIYFIISRNIAQFALAACIVPALAFCGLVYLKGGRGAMILSAVAFPFLLPWEMISQNLAILFFMFAIALKDGNKPAAGAMFALGCLSHRMGVWLGLVILVACLLPFERVKPLVDRAKALLILALAAIFIISLFFHCPPFAEFSRSYLLMGLMLWSFRSDDARLSGLFIMLIIGSVMIQLQGMDGNRILFVMQPLAVLGMAIQGKAAGSPLMLYLLCTGLFLLCYGLVENRAPAMTQGVMDRENGCMGMSLQHIIEKAVGIINSGVKDISGGGDDA